MTFRPLGNSRFAGIIAAVAIGLAGCSSATPPTPATAATTRASTTMIPGTNAPPSIVPSPTGAEQQVQTVIVPTLAGAIAAVGSQVWIIAGNDIEAVDFPSKQVHTVNVNGSELDGIAAGQDAVWVEDFGADQLIKIDPSSYQIIDRVSVPSPEDALEVNGTVWVTDHEQGSVTLVDAATDKVVKTVIIGDVGTDGPQSVAFGLGSVWITEKNTNDVVRMDPATDAIIAKIQVPGLPPCWDIATTSKAVWVAGCFDTVDKIDPTTNQTVASVTLASQGETPIVIDDSVWIAITDEIDQLDPATAKIDKQVSVPQSGAGGPSLLVGQTLYVSDNVASLHAIPVDLLIHTAP